MVWFFCGCVGIICCVDFDGKCIIFCLSNIFFEVWMICEFCILVVVVCWGFFVVVGEQVGLMQLVVSVQICVLECSVGVELFKCILCVVYLNEVGWQVVCMVEQIFMLFDGIGQGDSLCGCLCIGVVNMVQIGLLLEVFKCFVEQVLYIELQVVLGVLLYLLDQVDVVELDLVIFICLLFNLLCGFFV